jgi:hypothetical protein
MRTPKLARGRGSGDSSLRPVGAAPSGRFSSGSKVLIRGLLALTIQNENDGTRQREMGRPAEYARRHGGADAP